MVSLRLLSLLGTSLLGHAHTAAALPTLVNANLGVIPQTGLKSVPNQAFTLPPAFVDHDRVIRDRYIVSLRSDIGRIAVQEHVDWVADLLTQTLAKRSHDGNGGDAVPTYGGVEKHWHVDDLFVAYLGNLPVDVVELIQGNASVLHVEPLGIFEATADVRMVSQEPAPWGLGAISHREPGRDEYVYAQGATGAGTWAYVVDSGIRTTHDEFEGRAVWGYSAYPDVGFVDDFGHGTHCAGTIGARTYGVAKQAGLVAVKVLDRTGRGTTAHILDGLEWAVNNITAEGRADAAVVSVSIQGDYSPAASRLVEAARRRGVLVVAAAGNTDDDAAQYSPGSAPDALTVGAVDANHTRAAFSNWGPSVDLFAPGVNVLSAWNSGDQATYWMTGTSMAAPHVAGLLLYLKTAYEGFATADDAVENLKNLAQSGVVDDAKGAANLLAYNGSGR